MAFDIVGSAFDIVGAGGDFEVGARGRRGPVRGGAGGRFAGVTARATPETTPRVLIIGFPTFGSIAAAGTATQSVRPQKPFRADRLVIPVAAVGIVINQFLIGTDPVFANAGGEVDATVFSATAVGTQLQANTAIPGIDITLQLTNTTAAAVTVRGVAIIGIALDR